MVAVIVFHSQADVDWATALVGDLGEHAPVRIQLTQTPPLVTIGTSVVRVALWSDDAEHQGVGMSFAEMLTPAPSHSILVRRGGCRPPAGTDPATLASDICVDHARDGATALRASIRKIGEAVAQNLKTVRQREENRRRQRLQLADNLLLAAAIAGVAGLGAWQDWGGVRSAILSSGQAFIAAAE